MLIGGDEQKRSKKNKRLLQRGPDKGSGGGAFSINYEAYLTTNSQSLFQEYGLRGD